MTLEQSIQPTLFHKPATKIVVDNVNVVFKPDEWAVIKLVYMDDNGNALKHTYVPMTVEESMSWSGDDNYVLQLAFSKL